jgi:signal transduction histidine kinase
LKDINIEKLVEINQKYEELNIDLENIVIEEIAKNMKKEKVLMEQSKMAEMGQMIGVIAHQLKQPVSVIRMSAESIKFSVEHDLDYDIKQVYTKIMAQADFMTETINLFRNFFNPNKQQEDVELSSVLNKTLTILNDFLIEVEIIKDFQINNKCVTIFQNEIIQVCINILKNAYEIQEEKQISKKIIKISIYEDGIYQVISIQDNAGGINEKIIDQVFDQYFSTKDSNTGTGIGLNLAKQILEKQHNGKITVENKKFIHNNVEYIGACFNLIFTPKF